MRLPTRQRVAAWGKETYELVSETLDEYTRDRGEMVAAGLAFFTLLSMAPLIIIAVAIAGAILGQGTARGEALQLVRESMGSSAASTVGGWVDQAAASGGLASVVGGVLILYTASRLGEQLRVALNQAWNVDAYLAQGFKATVRNYVQRRLFAFVLVLASGPLLLAVFASRALLSGLSTAVFGATPFFGTLVELGQILFSVLSVWLISAIVFKVVPDTRVGWHVVWRGALLTSLLFNLGNWLVGFYLGRASVAAAYGAAGSAIVVLLWLYFSAQMFLFGAEFTQVYARRHGRALSPRENDEQSRAEAAGQQHRPAASGARAPGTAHAP